VLIVIGSVVASEGRLDELLALGREHVARSRAEPGCLSHAVHRDVEDPNRLVFVERWTDRAALDAHFALSSSRAFVKAAAALAAGRPVIDVYEVSS
jgi:quinol monooxygenase YgiN